MKFVIVESPFATRTIIMPNGSEYVVHQDGNVSYARACMHECLAQRNEAPYASHLLYTQPHVLDDDVPHERELGIRAGLEIGSFAQLRIFFLDRGFSSGMAQALKFAEEIKQPCAARFLKGHDIGWKADPEVLERIRQCGQPRE